MKKTEIFFGSLRVPLDFFLTFFAFLLAYQVRSQTDLLPGIQLPVDLGQFMPWESYIVFSLLASFAFALIMALNRAYELKVTTSLSRELFQVFTFSLAWVALLMAYFFLARQTFFSRLVLIYSWAFTVIFISMGRMLIRAIHYSLLKKGIGKRKVLFIGINEITIRLFEALKNDPRYTIIGAIDTDHLKKDFPFEILGNIKQLKYIVKKHFIDEIIQTKQNFAETQGTDILEFCREHQIQYSFVPDMLEVQLTNVDLEQINNLPLISLKPSPLDGWGQVMKRLFDLIIGLILFTLLIPLFMIMAIAIKLDSEGTILFKHLDDGKIAKRVGQKGRKFVCYKFRTMKSGTHNMRYNELADKNKRKGSPMVKIQDDPRVTRVGKLLRKFSIDELPQLWNVIRGEMSLVGPRPHLPEEVANYKKHHKFVLTLKPGITGLAQINGRSDLNFEEEVKLDTYYIEHWSMWLDIKIIIRTFFVVLSGKAE